MIQHMEFIMIMIYAFSSAAYANSSFEKPVQLNNPFFAMDTCTQKHYPMSDSDFSPEQQLSLVKELGYKGMSWTLGDVNQVIQVENEAKQLNLRIYALYVQISLTRGGLIYPSTLAQAINALKGTDTIIWLMIGSDDIAKSSPEGDAIAEKGLRDLAEIAQSSRLRIALYPHAGTWLERIQDAIRVAKKVNRRNVGVTFNLCHCLFVGDEKIIPQLLKEVHSHLFMVTINGADSEAAGASWSRLIQPLGDGTYNPTPLLKLLKVLKYNGPIGLQGFGLQGNIRQNLTQSISAWRKMTGQK